MKIKLLPIALLALLTIACNTNKKTNQTETTTSAKTACCDSHHAKASKVYTVESLMESADKLVDQEIQVKGNVLHTCKHSGRRCFLAGDDEKVTIRVEAAGKIKGFNQELVGSEIIVTGFVKERRLTKEYIDNYEHQLQEKSHQEDGSAESCAAENNNITKMRNWMKEHNSDYYAIYYIQGEDYESIQ